MSAVMSLPRAWVGNNVSINGLVFLRELRRDSQFHLVPVVKPCVERHAAVFKWDLKDCPPAVEPPMKPAASISMPANGIKAGVEARYSVTIH